VKNGAVEINVFGRVQGVGYRYFCYRKALSLNLNGWVKNNFDGSVSTFAEGDMTAVEGYVEELKTGCHGSKVEKMDVVWKDYSGQYVSFEIMI